MRSRRWICRRFMPPIAVTVGVVRRYDPAMMVALFLYSYARRRALLAGDRASLRGGCRLPGDQRQPGARSRDDRALSRRVTRTRWPACSARCLVLCAKAGLVARRGGRRRWHQGCTPTPRIARIVDYERDRARDPRRGRGGRRRRGRALRRSRAATSCRRSLRRQRRSPQVAAGGAGAGSTPQRAGRGAADPARARRERLRQAKRRLRRGAHELRARQRRLRGATGRGA